MKNNLKVFLSSGIPFGIAIGIFVGIINNIYFGIISGIGMGFLFGLIISTFIFFKSKEFMKNSMAIGENIVLEGAANHFKGKESVGGWLLLTGKEIVFQSHNFNIQTYQTTIPLNQIAEVKTSMSLIFIPNGINIRMINGVIERFVVNNRKNWIENINAAIYLFNNC